ncbi:O-methyltransferase [bacterium]|nr:O-methyltransferase [bacterium]
MQEVSLQEKWTAVDAYINSLLVPSDEVLDAVLASGAKAGLPPHNVSPAQGKFLHLLARMQGARKILEIGTLFAYSTIWLARALPPDGRLVTLEASPLCLKTSRENIARASLEEKVQIIPGKALETLPILVEQAPFDFIFIDADKIHNPDYFSWALKLSRVGTIIMIDNVIRNGEVLEEEGKSLSVQGIRSLNDMLAAEPRVSATTIQTVGSKGHDGFTLALVTALEGGGASHV